MKGVVWKDSESINDSLYQVVYFNLSLAEELDGKLGEAFEQEKSAVIEMESELKEIVSRIKR